MLHYVKQPFLWDRGCCAYNRYFRFSNIFAGPTYGTFLETQERRSFCPPQPKQAIAEDTIVREAEADHLEWGEKRLR